LDVSVPGDAPAHRSPSEIAFRSRSTVEVALEVGVGVMRCVLATCGGRD
jgi:hypothetical protein